MNKLLLKIIQATLLYKIYASIKWLYIYARDYNYVADTFYSDQFSYVLKRYLNVDFKKDWIGRLYAVIISTMWLLNLMIQIQIIMIM